MERDLDLTNKMKRVITTPTETDSNNTTLKSLIFIVFVIIGIIVAIMCAINFIVIIGLTIMCGSFCGIIVALVLIFKNNNNDNNSNLSNLNKCCHWQKQYKTSPPPSPTESNDHQSSPNNDLYDHDYMKQKTSSSTWKSKHITEWTCQQLQEWIISIELRYQHQQTVLDTIAQQQIKGEEFNLLQDKSDITNSFPDINAISVNKIFAALKTVQTAANQLIQTDATSNKYPPNTDVFNGHGEANEQNQPKPSAPQMDISRIVSNVMNQSYQSVSMEAPVDDKLNFKSSLEKLKNMGFDDEQQNMILLRTHKGDLEAVIQDLVVNDEKSPPENNDNELENLNDKPSTSSSNSSETMLKIYDGDKEYFIGQKLLIVPFFHKLLKILSTVIKIETDWITIEYDDFIYDKDQKIERLHIVNDKQRIQFNDARKGSMIPPALGKANSIILEPDFKLSHKDSDKECVVCMDERSSFAFIPCGHLCVCEQCKDLINEQCPICQQKYSSLIKIYF